MKTNQVIKRPLGNFFVLQRSKDGMFNATALLQQWNTAMQIINVTKKELKEYFVNKNTQEFIKALEEDENLHKGKSPYVEQEGKKPVYIKSRARADRGGGTWMHPLLFVDFAMWLNPRFKVKVLRFVADQMLAYRDDAGEKYKEIAPYIQSMVGKGNVSDAMSKLSVAFNTIVFGKHKKEMHNQHGTEKLQKELSELESQVLNLLKFGFIKNFEQLIEYLRKVWYDKYTPKSLK